MNNSQTMISILVWLVVINCFARVVSGMDGLQIVSDDIKLKKMELVDQLNMLLRHPGWQIMKNVKIMETQTINDKKREVLGDPMSVIFEAISSNRNPVDQINVLQRHDQVWTVLRCKYADVLDKYRVLVQHLIRICRMEKNEDKKTGDPSRRRYFNCFNSLLTKLHITSPRFKCMKDALEFFHSMWPLRKSKNNIMMAIRKLTEFTLTVKPTTLSKLSEHGIDEDAVDFEIKAISKFFTGVFHSNLYWFIGNYCNFQAPKELTSHVLKTDFEEKKSNNMIPEETTILQYLEDEIDCFINEIFGGLFFNLGFLYGVGDEVRIGVV